MVFSPDGRRIHDRSSVVFREQSLRRGIRPGLPPHLQPRLMILPGGHPGRTGGLWLWMILVLSLFHAVVVPSGFRTTVQPHW